MSAFVSSSLLTPEVLDSLDLTDTSSYRPMLVATSVVCLVLTVFITVLRTGVRLWINNKLFWEDIIIILSAVFNIALAAVTLISLHYGVGKHIWLLDLTNVVAIVRSVVQLMIINQVMYAGAIAATKISIMVLYYRIFPSLRFRRLIWALSTFTVLFGIASVFATVFQCIPVRAAWDFLMKERKCYTYVNFLYVNASVTLVTDIVVVLMPLPLFWKLKLPQKQKLILCSLFLLGGFACVASIVRITFMYRLTGVDVTFNISETLIWSLIEVTVGIFCVCIPPLRPLLSRMMPGKWSTRATSKNIYELSLSRKKPSQRSYADIGAGGSSISAGGHCEDAESAIKAGHVHVHTLVCTKEEPAYVASDGASTEELTAGAQRQQMVHSPSRGKRSVDLLAAAASKEEV